MEKIYLGTISILVKDRQTHAAEVNRLLTENGKIIMARLGVNVTKSCVENCTGLITVAVEGTAKEINALAKKLDKLYGIVARANLMSE